MPPERLLIDPEDPQHNELFRLRTLFQKITEDPDKSTILKIQILMQKASDLYTFYQRLGSDIKLIEARKYKTGSTEPILENMPLNEALNEADKCQRIYFDYESAKFNYKAIISKLRKTLKQFKVYEPFFDHVMYLLSVIKPQLERIQKVEEADQEKKKLTSDLDDQRKKVMYQEETIKDLQDQLSKTNQIWEQNINEIFVNIADNMEKWKFLGSLPQWSDLKTEHVGIVSKVMSYALLKNKSEVTANEIVTNLGIEDVTALTEMPFITFIGRSKFKIDFEGLKNHLAKNDKVNFAIDKKNWMVKLKDGVGKCFGKDKTKGA